MRPAFVTPINRSLRRTFQLCACMMLLLWSSCKEESKKEIVKQTLAPSNQNIFFENKQKVIHVFVALCDNEHQGIIPVPKAIGNGKDAENNLYWGCDYGIKTFFKNKTQWKLIQSLKNPAEHILERCIFKYTINNSWLVADAYDGEFIKQCTLNFLESCSGNLQKVIIAKDSLGIGGNAQVLAYIGHDGLMDFKLNNVYKPQDKRNREAIILACKSKQFFSNIIQQTGAKPLLWTTQLMCPEAYTLDAAISGWLNNETDIQIHHRASLAYSKYQKCGIKGASGLLTTGF
jgi:hypothetical protein